MQAAWTAQWVAGALVPNVFTMKKVANTITEKNRRKEREKKNT